MHRFTLAKKPFIITALALFSSLAIHPFTYAQSAGNMLAPFDIGTSWNVCQGYNNTGGTHVGTSQLSLDLTSAGCDNSASKKPVRSPFSGTVSWYVEGSGSMCITSSSSNLSVMLTHTDKLVEPGAIVKANQKVSTVAAPGKRQNNNVSHLHLQAWKSQRCQGDINQIPFDSAHNARMCGAPDMKISGPKKAGAGTWAGTRFKTDSCITIAKKATGTIYRFWSEKNKHHFYTDNYNEAQHTASTWPDVWSYESSANFRVVPLNTGCSDSSEVYRFYSEKYKGHFYTISAEERDHIRSTYSPNTWSYEGAVFCAYSTKTTDSQKPLYRFYSDKYHAHFYTDSEDERAFVIKNYPDIWNYEGVAFYVS